MIIAAFQKPYNAIFSMQCIITSVYMYIYVDCGVFLLLLFLTSLCPTAAGFEFYGILVTATKSSSYVTMSLGENMTNLRAKSDIGTLL